MSTDTKFKVLKTRTLANFTNMLVSLLPVGPLWKQLNQSFTDFMEAFAVELNRLDQRCIDIQNESVPGLSTDTNLLLDWERVLLTPDEMPSSSATESERQGIVDAKYYLQTKSPTSTNLIAYAAALNITVTFGDVDYFRVGDNRVGDRLRGTGSAAYIVIVNHSGGTADEQRAMKAYFDNIRAHMLFEYIPAIP